MCAFANPEADTPLLCLQQHPAQPAIPGGGKVNQVGLFTEAAPGISMSNLLKSSTINYMIANIPANQVNYRWCMNQYIGTEPPERAKVPPTGTIETGLCLYVCNV